MFFCLTVGPPCPSICLRRKKKGTVTKSHKGKKANAERSVGECYQWKAISLYSEGDSCSFCHELASGYRCGRDQKNNRPLLHLKRRHRLTGKYPPKVQVAEVKALLGREAENRAKILSEESVRIHHVICGTLPCVTIQV